MTRLRCVVLALVALAVLAAAVALLVVSRSTQQEEQRPPPPRTASTAPPAVPKAPTTATSGVAGPMTFAEQVVDAENAGDCKATGDLDGDGAADAVIGGRSLVWYDFSAARAAPATRFVIRERAEREFSTDCQVGDVDGDGDLDLVVPDERKLLWFANPGPTGDVRADEWTETVIGETDDWTHDVEAADVDADGRLDVVTRRKGSTDLWLQQAPAAWSRVTISDQDGEGTAVGDVDGDGDLDIVAGGTWLEHPGGDPAAAGWVAHPIEAIAAGPIPVADLNWGSVAVADVDGDGRNDIVYGPMEQTGSKLAWYSPADGAATRWTEHLIGAGPVPAGFHGIEVADMDGDADLDVVTARMHSAQPSDVSVWVNDGGATGWTEVVLASSGLHNVRVGDVDGDGDLDVFGSNYVDNPPVRLFRNGRSAVAAG